jgi:uncharacterized membrane protein (DUF485 family)
VPDLSSHDIDRIARERRRVSLTLSAVMLGIYFGFILLGAYAKGFMGIAIVDGLSVGILFGALVIVAAFALTGIYVRWANAHDRKLQVSSDSASGEGAP